METKATKSKLKRTFVGEVVSDKMQKTIVVKVHRTFVHPKVHKVVRLAKKYKVHDEQNKAHVGDRVEFGECRPLSRWKNMELIRILKSSAIK